MSLHSRLSILKSLTGPIFLSEDVPPYWMRKENAKAVAIFENIEAFIAFNERFSYFSGEVAEVRYDGVVEISLGILQ